jgi:hypothetical protein
MPVSILWNRSVDLDHLKVDDEVHMNSKAQFYAQTIDVRHELSSAQKWTVLCPEVNWIAENRGRDRRVKNWDRKSHSVFYSSSIPFVRSACQDTRGNSAGTWRQARRQSAQSQNGPWSLLREVLHWRFRELLSSSQWILNPPKKEKKKEEKKPCWKNISLLTSSKCVTQLWYQWKVKQKCSWISSLPLLYNT